MAPLVYPNQANATLFPSVNASSTDNSLAFGAQMARVHIFNDMAAGCFVNFNSLVATTSGHRTCAGETLIVDQILCSGVSLASTATSTSPGVRVLALGA